MSKITNEQVALNRLNAKFKNVTLGKVKVGVEVFNTTEKALTFVTGILTNYQLGILIGNLDYRNSDGTKVSLSQSDFENISKSIQVLYSLSYDRYDALAAEIVASQTPLDVDLTTGWPTTPYELA